MKNSKGFFERKFATAIFSQTISMPLSLLGSIITARFLGPEGRGTYALALQIASAILLVGGLGIDMATIYFLGNLKKNLASGREIKAWILSILCFLILWIPFISTIASSSVQIYVEYSNTQNLDRLLISRIVILSGATILMSFCKSVLLIYDLNLYYLLNLINVLGITCILGVAIVYLGISSISTILTAQSILITGSSCVFIFIAFYKNISIVKQDKSSIEIYRHRFRKTTRIIKEVIFFTFRPQLGNIIQYIAYRFDFFVIASMVQQNAKILGYYSVATLLAEMIWIVPNTSSLIMNNILAQENLKDNHKALSTTIIITRQIFIVTFITAIVSIPIMPVIINLFFGHEYIESLFIYYILLPGSVMLSISKSISSYQLSQGRPEISFYINLTSLPIILFSYIILTNFMGIVGAAIASSISYTTISVIELCWLYKTDKESMKGLLTITKEEIVIFNLYMNKIVSLLNMKK
jgi:O-antigen/teichoic acid export membrane protein